MQAVAPKLEQTSNVKSALESHASVAAVANGVGASGWRVSSSAFVSFISSLVAHVGLILVLALLVHGSVQEQTNNEVLELIPDTAEGVDVDLLSLEMGSSGAGQAVEPMVADVPAAAMVLTEGPSAQLAMPAIGSLGESTIDLGKGFSSRITSAIQSGSGKGKGRGTGSGLTGTGTSFFGVETKGEKFVFVVDSSRSMMGRRWVSAIRELIKSLDALGPYQQFYVICFDFNARPVFDSIPGKDAYLQPDSQTVGRVQSWMQTLTNGFETRPASALQMAIAMEPDAIYLLSDGEIRDNSVYVLQALNMDQSTGKPIIPVHTISLFSTEGRQTLKYIADSNGGKFSSID